MVENGDFQGNVVQTKHLCKMEGHSAINEISFFPGKMLILCHVIDKQYISLADYTFTFTFGSNLQKWSSDLLFFQD